MKSYIVTVLLSLGLSWNASATLYTYNWTGINATIPDANPSGYVNNQTITDSMQGNSAFPVNPYIVSVVGVTINLSGGWNGDLVAYLRYDSGSGVGYTTLLNRVGGGPSSSIYTTSGMNVTLIEGAGSGNIHDTTPTSGNSYQVDSTGSSTSFSSFQGLDPTTGTWSLFFADLSGGNISTLNSWGLQLEVVPEPVNVALGIFGGALGLVALARSKPVKRLLGQKLAPGKLKGWTQRRFSSGSG